MNANNHFSNKLKACLNNQNISEVARKLDIPKSLLHDWICSKRGPSLSSMHHVKKLSDLLGISFEELILGDSCSHPKTISTVMFSDNNMKYSITIARIDNTQRYE